MNDFGLFVPVIAGKLRKVLQSEAHSDFIASGRGNKVIQAAKVDRRKLVDDNAGFEFAFFVDKTDDATVVEAEGCGIDILAVRIIAYAQHFGFLGIVYVQCKIISRHDPIELRGDHT